MSLMTKPKDRFTIPLAWIAVGAMLILGQIAAFNGIFDATY
jgi:hypothetical protein